MCFTTLTLPPTASGRWRHGCFMPNRPAFAVRYKVYWLQQVSILPMVYSAADSTHRDPARFTMAAGVKSGREPLEGLLALLDGE